MNIGENIKLFRKQKGLTQKELGESIGVTGTTITRYEKNIRTPDINTLSKIANKLEISLNFLLSVDLNYKDILISDILIFLKEKFGLIENWLIDYTPTHKDLQKAFKDYFSLPLPDDTGEITENILCSMLCIIINNDLDFFIKLFNKYSEFISTFNKTNLLSINECLSKLNLNINMLSNPKQETNLTQDNTIALSKIYDSLGIINDNKLTTDILLNIYNDSDLKDCLVYLKNKYLLKHKFNQEGDGNDNKES